MKNFLTSENQLSSEEKNCLQILIDIIDEIITNSANLSGENWDQEEYEYNKETLKTLSEDFREYYPLLKQNPKNLSDQEIEIILGTFDDQFFTPLFTVPGIMEKFGKKLDENSFAFFWEKLLQQIERFKKEEESREIERLTKYDILSNETTLRELYDTLESYQEGYAHLQEQISKGEEMMGHLTRASIKLSIAHEVALNDQQANWNIAMRQKKAWEKELKENTDLINQLFSDLELIEKWMQHYENEIASIQKRLEKNARPAPLSFGNSKEEEKVHKEYVLKQLKETKVYQGLEEKNLAPQLELIQSLQTGMHYILNIKQHNVLFQAGEKLEESYNFSPYQFFIFSKYYRWKEEDIAELVKDYLEEHDEVTGEEEYHNIFLPDFLRFIKDLIPSEIIKQLELNQVPPLSLQAPYAEIPKHLKVLLNNLKIKNKKKIWIMKENDELKFLGSWKNIRNPKKSPEPFYGKEAISFEWENLKGEKGIFISNGEKSDFFEL